MKKLNYFFQFTLIIIFFIIFKFIGLKNASSLGGFLGKFLGPYFRSKKIIIKNLNICFKNITSEEIKKISNSMWSNIGRTFAEYVFLKKFSKNKNFVKINGLEYLEEIKKKNEKVIFISGHFANFELMAMHLNQNGIKLAAIYRPLNNIFLNPLMEYLRKKYICPIQIKKGKDGLKKLLSAFKNGVSIALMIDQRVSQGMKVNLFSVPAFTTTIPAQFVLRYNCKIVPIYIERKNSTNFIMNIKEPLEFGNLDKNKNNVEQITLKLNQIIEKMITNNPEQWIWSHNRWK